ncbi:MAG: hypothetical protein N2689_00485 [Verrucomicrobiae bacterium]|nr:hypothetical protein [Verrucomicrobiae bacterium]
MYYYFVPLKAVAIIVGVLAIATRLPGVINPVKFREVMRKFPRAVWPGIVFLTIALVWSILIVHLANEEGMALPKSVVITFLLGVYVGMIVLRFDFLAARGLAILLLFFAKITVDAANQIETPWRLVMTVLAYAWAVMGMWFTVAPWRMRDMIEWSTASDRRTRALCAAGCGFGVFLILLGVFAY